MTATSQGSALQLRAPGGEGVGGDDDAAGVEGVLPRPDAAAVHHHRGQVELRQDILPFDRIYCCGPDPMMKAVSQIAAKHGTDCEVSLENTMACGFGVCLCCVTPTVRGNERVCMEGPVFNTKDLTWEVMHLPECKTGGASNDPCCQTK